MTLDDFKQRIDRGGAACRVDAWDSALVFKAAGYYYVRGLDETEATPCTNWRAVHENLGDWADYGGWQEYRQN